MAPTSSSGALSLVMYPEAPRLRTRTANWFSGMHAQHEDWELGFGFLDLPQHLQPAATRHGDVQNHDIPILFPNQVERFLGVPGLAESRAFKIVGQDLLQPVPHYRVIVR